MVEDVPLLQRQNPQNIRNVIQSQAIVASNF
jgi:hypothetical protein